MPIYTETFKHKKTNYYNYKNAPFYKGQSFFEKLLINYKNIYGNILTLGNFIITVSIIIIIYLML